MDIVNLIYVKAGELPWQLGAAIRDEVNWPVNSDHLDLAAIGPVASEKALMAISWAEQLLGQELSVQIMTDIPDIGPVSERVVFRIGLL